MKEPPPFKEWTTCVEAADDAWLEQIARWRGIDPHYFRWLSKNHLFGCYKGQPAFPVTYNGVVVAIHYRAGRPADSDQKAQWFYHPKLSDLGIAIQPFIIGDLALADKVYVFESQWDQCAVDYGLDYLHNSFKLVTLSTRGAANARLLKMIPESVKEIVLFPQNDDAGRKWEAEALTVLSGRKMTIGYTPPDYKDAGEWVAAGAEREDLVAAMKPVQLPNEDPHGRIGNYDPVRLQQLRDDFRARKGVFAQKAAAPDQEPRQLTGTSILSLSKREIDYSRNIAGNRWLELCTGGFVIAPSGHGKSTLTIQLAILWSCGRVAFGIKPAKPLRILIVQSEDPDNDVIAMAQMCRRLALSETEAASGRE